MKSYINAALNHAEKLTKTDVRYVARGSFWLGMTQVTSAIVGIAMTAGFANLISPETFGLYRYILSVYGILAMAGLPGAATGVTQAVSTGHEGALLQGFKLKIRWSLLGSAVSLAYASYNFITHQPTLGIVFCITAVIMPLYEAAGLYVAHLHGKKLFKEASIMAIIMQFAFAVAMLSALYWGKNIFVIIATYFAIYTISYGIFTFITLRRYTTNNSIDPDMKRYSRSMSFYNIVNGAISSIDGIVLFHLLGPAQVAIFALASAIPTRLQTVLKILGTLAFPKYAQRSMADISSNFPRKALLLLGGIIITAIIYGALAPTIFTILFPKYLPALHYSQVLAFFTISAITYPLSSAFLAHKLIRPGYIIAIVSIILKVVLLLTLVPLLGLWGAVIGILTTSVVAIGVAFYFLYHYRSRDQTKPTG
jgi:O-antigen/teichoic acid export membrane protein